MQKPGFCMGKRHYSNGFRVKTQLFYVFCTMFVRATASVTTLGSGCSLAALNLPFQLLAILRHLPKQFEQFVDRARIPAPPPPSLDSPNLFLPELGE